MSFFRSLGGSKMSQGCRPRNIRVSVDAIPDRFMKPSTWDIDQDDIALFVPDFSVHGISDEYFNNPDNQEYDSSIVLFDGNYASILLSDSIPQIQLASCQLIRQRMRNFKATVIAHVLIDSEMDVPKSFFQSVNSAMLWCQWIVYKLLKDAEEIELEFQRGAPYFEFEVDWTPQVIEGVFRTRLIQHLTIHEYLAKKIRSRPTDPTLHVFFAYGGDNLEPAFHAHGTTVVICSPFANLIPQTPLHITRAMADETTVRDPKGWSAPRKTSNDEIKYTVGGAVSNFLGALLHELLHGFGLPHMGHGIMSDHVAAYDMQIPMGLKVNQVHQGCGVFELDSTEAYMLARSYHLKQSAVYTKQSLAASVINETTVRVSSIDCEASSSVSDYHAPMTSVFRVISRSSTIDLTMWYHHVDVYHVDLDISDKSFSYIVVNQNSMLWVNCNDIRGIKQASAAEISDYRAALARFKAVNEELEDLTPAGHPWVMPRGRNWALPSSDRTGMLAARLQEMNLATTSSK